MKNVMFVCTGNICRSAMAEKYFNYKISEKNLEEKYKAISSGTSAINGESSTENAIEVMKKYGVDLSNHEAVHIKNADILNADYIFAMTQAHKDTKLLAYPELKDKTYILKEYIGICDYVDIDDPWGWDYTVYENCAKEIVVAVDKLLYILTEK